MFNLKPLKLKSNYNAVWAIEDIRAGSAKIKDVYISASQDGKSLWVRKWVSPVSAGQIHCHQRGFIGSLEK